MSKKDVIVKPENLKINADGQETEFAFGIYKGKPYFTMNQGHYNIGLTFSSAQYARFLEWFSDAKQYVVTYDKLETKKKEIVDGHANTVV